MPCYAVVFPSRILKHQNYIRKYYQDNIKCQKHCLRKQKIYFLKYWQLNPPKDLGFRIFENINGGVLHHN